MFEDIELKHTALAHDQVGYLEGNYLLPLKTLSIYLSIIV